MLLCTEHATIDVVLCASGVSMFVKLPILIVPPYFGFWALASEGRPRPPAARPSPAPPSIFRTSRRCTSWRSSSLTTSNPSRLFILVLLPSVRSIAASIVVEMAGGEVTGRHLLQWRLDLVAAR